VAELTDVPDIYCDGVNIAMTPYDLLLLLTQQKAKITGSGQASISPSSVGVVRMSLEHAKVLAILLKRNLKEYEDKVGTIPLHPEAAKNLGISKEEDW
jgi:hypothetical protein